MAPLGAQTPRRASAGSDLPPRPEKEIDPVCPLGSLAQLDDDAVALSMTVDVTGRPHDVKVVRSTGVKAFDCAALQAIRRWFFTPATQDGRPVGATYRMPRSSLANSLTRLASGARSAHKEFTNGYIALKNALQAKDRAAADAALKQMHVTNHYEEACHGLAAYQYAFLWGTEKQQIAALRRAVFPDKGVQDFVHTHRHLERFDPYLPTDVWKTAMLTLLKLDLRAHEFSEALDLWAWLQWAGVKREVVAQFIR